MARPLLPWIDTLLENVKHEYSQPVPDWKEVNPKPDDFEYVKSILGSPSGFSSDVFIREVITNGFPLKKYVSNTIEFLIFSASIHTVPFSLWFRIARLLAQEKHVRVIYFGNLQKRIPPKPHNPIEAEHINGGYTNSCNFKTVVIYREEDSTRVLIHELLHASCSDPHTSTPFIEADTEAWAEVIFCALKAKGNKKLWEDCMKQQIKFAFGQALYVMKIHKVHTPNDYAWRYIIGRLKVWELLGFELPKQSEILKTDYNTLRLTYTDI